MDPTSILRFVEEIFLVSCWCVRILKLRKYLLGSTRQGFVNNQHEISFMRPGQFRMFRREPQAPGAESVKTE